MEIARRYTKQYDIGATVAMADVLFSTNDFVREHLGLDAVIQRIIDQSEGTDGPEDLTLEMFDDIEDDHIKSSWEKARYVAENIACLWAAEHLVGWGMGYRSDDGYDYLTAAIDNVQFLTDIDLSEDDFLLWWNCPPDTDEHFGAMNQLVTWGASDGEVRYMLFPIRSDL